jgi:hypothetical protein
VAEGGRWQNLAELSFEQGQNLIYLGLARKEKTF